MRRALPPVLAGIALACLVALGAWFTISSAERRGFEAGELAARTHVLDSIATVQAAEVRRVDTVARVDSVRFVQWRTRYVATTDTVVVDSIVYVNKATADSTVNACTEALGSCATRVAARDRLIRTLYDRRAADSLALRQAVTRQRTAAVKGGVVGGVIGFTGGALACAAIR